jgi:hypothetical protein
MRIKVGNTINKRVIKNILKIVPKKDLKDISSIYVQITPDQEIKKEHRAWGGLLGQYRGGNSKFIKLYLYAINNAVNEKFNIKNSNWYHLAYEGLASTLLHEIGHHKMYSDPWEIIKQKFADNFFEWISSKFAYPTNYKITNIRNKIFGMNWQSYSETFAERYANYYLNKLKIKGYFSNVNPFDLSF